MSYSVLSILESAVFIGFFLIAVYIFVPKAIKLGRLWKETNKTTHLTNAVAASVGAFFFLTADFLIFIRAVIGI
jgi:O-antigen ligase